MNDGIFGEIFLVHPGELREQLQVAPVAEGPVGDACFRSARAQLGRKFGKARPAIDEIFVDLECALEGFALLLRLQAAGMGEGNVEPRFLKAAANVLFDLLGEERDEVEGCVDAGKFAREFSPFPSSP